jgi:hypothetical protein
MNERANYWYSLSPALFEAKKWSRQYMYSSNPIQDLLYITFVPSPVQACTNERTNQPTFAWELGLKEKRPIEIPSDVELWSVNKPSTTGNEVTSDGPSRQT